MNSSAPSFLTNSSFRPEPVPITYAPLFFASCTAIVSPTRTSAADDLHRPRDFTTKNQRRLQAEHLSQSIADFPIDRIYRCRPHFHQQLIISRLGPFHFREFHHLFISITLDPHCF